MCLLCNIIVQDGKNPMHYAAYYGHKEFAEWLFSIGASVTDKDKVRDVIACALASTS